eukprot:1639280-Amphidinium_carterae.1
MGGLDSRGASINWHSIMNSTFCACRGGGTQYMAHKSGAWLYFEDLIVGSSLMGEYTSVGALPGSKGSLEGGLQMDIVRAFVNRIYAGFGYPLLQERRRSTRDVKLHIIVGANE